MKPLPNAVPFPDGLLIVDKPEGWTSHDVVDFVRKRFRIAKVGHAGTLDPMATGLLVLLLGRATKQSGELSGQDKDYEGVLRLGIKTDSQDRTGKITGEADPSAVTLEDVRAKAVALTGELLQVPPMVSALKHQGVRLYKLARQGREVPRESRPVTVHAFKILEKNGPLVSFFVSVSKGTYIRTLGHDLGESLGCFAVLENLRRLRSGTFDLSRRISIEELKQISPEELKTRMIPLGTLWRYADSQGN